MSNSISQIMTSRPRSDICINLPALRKLEAMLLVSAKSHPRLERVCIMENWI